LIFQCGKDGVDCIAAGPRGDGIEFRAAAGVLHDFRGDFRERKHDSTPHVTLIVVDQDKSEGSENLVRTLEQDGSLWIHRSPVNQKGGPGWS
jgi:hypothetical protein